MPLPAALRSLSLPLISAPMFLVSGPKLVTAACRQGILGTFPSVNCRSVEALDQWITDIKSDLSSTPTTTGDDVPFGVNLILEHMNPRVPKDLEVLKKHKVPVVITSLGYPEEVVKEVHSYGGLVFHDVVNLRHAEKAVQAGVDGLILVCAGAGGHAGTFSPFAFVPQARRAFPDKTIILSGCMSSGYDIRAAEVMGADLAYMGTRFIATEESMASDDYKKMVTTEQTRDIIYTPAISGVPANFMKSSIAKAGLDPDNLPPPKAVGVPDLAGSEAKRWRDIWSAGHGVGVIGDVPPLRMLTQRLKVEYDEACDLPSFTNTQSKL